MGKVSTAILAVMVLSGCAPQSDTDGASATSVTTVSAISAQMIGRALNMTSSNGSYALHSQRPFYLQMLSTGAEMFLPSAFAAGTCLQPATASGSIQCAVSGKALWLDHSACAFGSSSTQWSGTMMLEVSGANSQSTACGAFPTAGNSGAILRQFVSTKSLKIPLTLSIADSNMTTVIDDSSANLAVFDVSHSVSPLANGGYGVIVNLNSSGGRNSIQIAERQYVTGVYDYSVEGTLNITESAGATSRVLLGTLNVYDNIKKIIGTVAFNSITFSDACTSPVSGTITTTFAASPNVTPTAAGQALVGESETYTGNCTL